VKLNHPIEIHYFFLKQISNSRPSCRSPICRADTTDDLLPLKLHLSFTATDVFRGELDTTIALSAGFDGLSDKRIASRISRI
jgi:hypothetical protein